MWLIAPPPLHLPAPISPAPCSKHLREQQSVWEAMRDKALQCLTARFAVAGVTQQPAALVLRSMALL